MDLKEKEKNKSVENVKTEQKKVQEEKNLLKEEEKKSEKQLAQEKKDAKFKPEVDKESRKKWVRKMAMSLIEWSDGIAPDLEDVQLPVSIGSHEKVIETPEIKAMIKKEINGIELSDAEVVTLNTLEENELIYEIEMEAKFLKLEYKFSEWSEADKAFMIEQTESGDKELIERAKKARKNRNELKKNAVLSLERNKGKLNALELKMISILPLDKQEQILGRRGLTLKEKEEEYNKLSEINERKYEKLSKAGKEKFELDIFMRAYVGEEDFLKYPVKIPDYEKKEIYKDNLDQVSEYTSGIKAWYMAKKSTDMEIKDIADQRTLERSKQLYALYKKFTEQEKAKKEGQGKEPGDKKQNFFEKKIKKMEEYRRDRFTSTIMAYLDRIDGLRMDPNSAQDAHDALFKLEEITRTYHEVSDKEVPSNPNDIMAYHDNLREHLDELTNLAETSKRVIGSLYRTMGKSVGFSREVVNIRKELEEKNELPRLAKEKARMVNDILSGGKKKDDSEDIDEIDIKNKKDKELIDENPIIAGEESEEKKEDKKPEDKAKEKDKKDEKAAKEKEKKEKEKKEREEKKAKEKEEKEKKEREEKAAKEKEEKEKKEREEKAAKEKEEKEKKEREEKERIEREKKEREEKERIEKEKKDAKERAEKEKKNKDNETKETVDLQEEYYETTGYSYISYNEGLYNTAKLDDKIIGKYLVKNNGKKYYDNGKMMKSRTNRAELARQIGDIENVSNETYNYIDGIQDNSLLNYLINHIVESQDVSQDPGVNAYIVETLQARIQNNVKYKYDSEEGLVAVNEEDKTKALNELKEIERRRVLTDKSKKTEEIINGLSDMMDLLFVKRTIANLSLITPFRKRHLMALIDEKTEKIAFKDKPFIYLPDVKQKEFQSGYECWADTTSNLLRYAGYDVKIKDVKSYGVKKGDFFDQNRNNYNDISDYADYILGKAKGYSLEERGIICSTKDNGGLTIDEQVLVFKEAVVNALRENTPIGIGYSVHYQTVVGIDGDNLILKNPLSNDSNDLNQLTRKSILDIVGKSALQHKHAQKNGENAPGLVKMFRLKKIEYTDKAKTTVKLSGPGTMVYNNKKQAVTTGEIYPLHEHQAKSVAFFDPVRSVHTYYPKVKTT